jgi:hypothetical protein
MQYSSINNAMQCSNAIQCNAMQYNADNVYGPSVRTEWSQSVIYFFLFFKNTKNDKIC